MEKIGERDGVRMIDSGDWKGLVEWLNLFDRWRLTHEFGKDTYDLVVIPQTVDWGLPARAVRYVGRALKIDRLRRFRWGFEYHGRVTLEPHSGGILLRGIGKIGRRRIPWE